ncbi:MAG: hydantoinase/oxoprolinase family protein, partial [Pseudodonghicola sp.]
CDVSQRYVVGLTEHSSAALATALDDLKQKAARDMFAEGFEEGSYTINARLVAETPEGEVVHELGESAEFPPALVAAAAVELELNAIKSLRRGDGGHVSVSRKAQATPAGTRKVLVPEQGRVDLPVYRLNAMAPGDYAQGPAILEEDYFTARVPAGWTLAVSDAGDVILDREE